MTIRKLILAGALLAPAMFVQPAQAGEYCREYTKSIGVGGRHEEGYGTACLQPDGSWAIILTGDSGSPGRLDDRKDLRDRIDIHDFDDRSVYYGYGPRLRHVADWPRREAIHPNVFFSHGHRDGWNKHRRRGHDRGYYYHHDCGRHHGWHDRDD